ncbi:esterase family protein [Paenibacillus athensensis]|uniref:Esterase n=1 Tax=Paenibacillus athensensis TaxID=1967502 RepID=A0A4Y8Q3X4_9BACL|nr:alpha/beta hydrolase family protein [Paenibacillus athensensis]MCD1258438.1 esterase family protein [Paenibacillus athensensis]
MAFIDCHFYSETLGISTAMHVLLPQRSTTQIGMTGRVLGTGKHPVLYLLHGLSDDHTIWMRRTSIERYAAELGLAVVMPAVGRSFYTDMAHGYRYWTFVSEELPQLAREFFPLSAERELNFAAGLSMGGYGAMKLGLSHPERFAAVASLSGALDVRRFIDNPENMADFRLIFGDGADVAASDNNLLRLADKLAESGKPAPKLYQACGTEDFLYADNVRFRDYIRGLPFDLTYEEGPGIHDWAYWDLKIQSVLDWLPLPGR